MKPSTRSGLLWACVLASLVLSLARAANWEHRHDEGTTFDIAFHEMAVGEYIEDWPSPPVPMSELTLRLEGQSGYTARDTVDALSVDFRTLNPPLYYLAAHLWGRLVGSGQLVWRLPAVFLTALAVLGLAAIARRVVLGEAAGLWAAALFALSPWVISITNLARPYQLPLVFSVWSTLAVLELMSEKRRSRWWLLFAGCSLLGLYTVYHYVFVLAWQVGLLGLWSWRLGAGRRRAALLSLGRCVLVLAVGFLPWVPYLWRHVRASTRGMNYFEGMVAPRNLASKALATLTDFALADSIETTGGEVMVWAAAVLALLSLPLLIWSFAGARWRETDGRARLFWLSAPLMPLMLAATDLVLHSHTVFITKLCFGFMMLWILAVVRAWSCVTVRPLRIAGLSAWVLLLGSASVLGTWGRGAMENEIEAAAAVISQDDSATHLVVFSTDMRGYAIPFLLTMRDVGIEKVAVTAARQADLKPLLKQLQEDGDYRRVSLVNHYLPGSKGKLMWDNGHIHHVLQWAGSRGWNAARASRQWNAAEDWQPPQPTAGEGLGLWAFGPLAVRCIHGPR